MLSARASSLVLASAPSLVLWVLTRHTFWIFWSAGLLSLAVLLWLFASFPHTYQTFLHKLDRAIGTIATIPPKEERAAVLSSETVPPDLREQTAIAFVLHPEDETAEQQPSVATEPTQVPPTIEELKASIEQELLNAY